VEGLAASPFSRAVLLGDGGAHIAGLAMIVGELQRWDARCWGGDWKARCPSKDQSRADHRTHDGVCGDSVINRSCRDRDEEGVRL
jgi:hypothetical protein